MTKCGGNGLIGGLILFTLLLIIGLLFTLNNENNNLLTNSSSLLSNLLNHFQNNENLMIDNHKQQDEIYLAKGKVKLNLKNTNKLFTFQQEKRVINNNNKQKEEEEEAIQYIIKLSPKITRTNFYSTIQQSLSKNPSSDLIPEKKATFSSKEQEENNDKAKKFNVLNAFTLSKDNIFVLRAKRSQIESLLDSIEFIDNYKESYKTFIDFDKIQSYYEEQVLNKQAIDIVNADNDVNKQNVITDDEPLNDDERKVDSLVDKSLFSYVKVFLTVIHSLDAIEQGKEVEETQKLVDQLNSELKTLFSSSSLALSNNKPLYYPIRMESKDKLSFSFSPRIAKEVMSLILKNEGIHWVERQLPLKLFNYYPNTIIQGINGEVPEIQKNTNSSSSNNRLRIWDYGIDGEGEVVGVADTGIDWDQCFFNDPDTPLPINKVNFNHRKIVAYQTVKLSDDEGNTYESDTSDVTNGHGTHVAGSVAGSILTSAANYEELKRYNGIAPKAKLFFTDIMNSASAGRLLIPSDLYNNLFKIPYQTAKVKIHSNSWGCSFSGVFNCKYDCKCTWAITTEYGKQGDAAGDFCIQNFGVECCQICNSYDSRCQEIDKFTWDNDDFIVLFAAGNDGHVSSNQNIGTPTTSKNVISVGASQTTNEGFISSINHLDLTNALSRYELKSEQDCCNYQGNGNEDQKNFVRSLCCPTFMKKLYTDSFKYFNEANLAYFSGRGPTLGSNRIKPDFVAPGYEIESMHSDGKTNTFQCGIQRPSYSNTASILTSRGTSMSTPITAGAAALVRHYYRIKTKHLNPSGSLIKATLAHSSQPMTGVVSLDGKGTMSDLTTLEYPNSYYGFGLVSLGSVLKFSDSLFNLFSFDREQISKDGERNVYCFRTIPNTKASGNNDFFRATLSWYDMPSSPNSDGKLINDLDLDVYVYTVNSTSSIRYPGNGVYSGDHTNNIEKVMVNNIGGDNKIIAVTVNGWSISATQKYALVFTSSDNIEQIGECNPPPAQLPPKTILTILIIIAVVSAVLLLTIGIIVLIVRNRMNAKNGQLGSESTTAGNGGGRTLGGNSGGRRLGDGLPVVEQSTQPVVTNFNGTHVRLEDEDVELHGGDSTVTVYPNRNNNNNNSQYYQ